MKAFLLSFSAILALSSLFLSSHVMAGELSPEQISSYLKIDPVYYKKGSFQGRAIDQSLKRPVRLISELETEESYFVSHFYNQGQFWVAEIPKQGVKKVIAQLALFKGPLGMTLTHLQYRFLMDVPVGLYRAKDGVLKKTRTNDLIFTVQAALPKGEDYDALEAMKGTYKMTSRLSNTFDRVIYEEVAAGDIVTQYALSNISQEQRDDLLFNSVNFSNQNLYEKDYKVATENCISISFDLLDQSLRLNRERVVLTLNNMFLNGRSPNEKLILEELRARNLIHSKSRIENYKK